jgi:parallel beta-helix repeat protein
MSDPASIDDRILAAILKAEDGARIYGGVANLPAGSYIETESGPIPSIAEWQMIHADALGRIPAIQTEIEALQAEQARLYNNIDPLQGASVLGFRRDNATLPNFVADILRDQAVSTFEAIPRSQWAAIKAGTSAYVATSAIQALLDWAAANNKAVIHPEGVLNTGTLIAKPGLKGFFGAGGLKCIDPSEGTGIGLIVVQGSFYGPTYNGLDDCYIGGGLKIDMNGSAKRGLFLNSLTNCRIDNITTRNLGRNSTAAIRLNWDCTDNIIQNCRSFMPVITSDSEACYGVQLVGSDIEYSGWGTGAIVPATHKNLRNKIVDCWSYNGTHGFSLTGSDENIIIGCTGYGNKHRALHLINSSSNVFNANHWLFFGSAAMIMAYGSSRNIGVGNICFSSVDGGESGIECYVGSSYNFISGGTVRTGGNYGLYVAIDSNGNEFTNLTVDCTSTKKAGIAIESDWMASPPAGTLPYSRPNYGAPPSPKVTWATAGTNANIFKNVTLKNGNASIAAVYGSQVGTVGPSILNSIIDCHFEESSFNHLFYLAEVTSGLLTQWNISKTTTNYQAVGKSFATRGRAHLQSCFGNDTFNGNGYYAPPTNAAQPSVFASDKLNLSGYTAPTNTNYFSGGMPGQRVEVLLGTNNTLVHTAGQFILKGATNVVGAVNSIIRFENRAGIWFETGRNF